MEYYNRFVHDQDDSPETASGSPLSGEDTIMADTPSPKKSSRRISGKRVVTVAIADGDVYPPADSWAWRKYGQKPIKGSPNPRGYYRCSSSKGCPARKQVERSRKDPTVVVITYACEHNHLIPTTTKQSQPTIPVKFPPEEVVVFANQTDLEPDNIDFAEFVADFGYFTNITSVILESTVITSPCCMEPDSAVIFTRGDDEDSLFADLGELPGCSLIFQQ
uniref:WRKY5 n=1 Tax=Panax quinquefolius TaxID=44588 RepID=K4EP04_PANQU|nr:WRKY5 [Panax quinquefolius]